jgi:DNA-binding PadR family transcriptional regulator
MRLTHNQLEMLKILGAIAPDTLTGPELADRMTGDGYEKSPEGIHQTAASLSRRGFVLKNRIPRLGHTYVVYAISPAGKHALKEHLKPRGRIRKGNS